MFGGRALSQAQQADYLRRAYRVAGRYSQVKALFWYLRRDHSPSGRADDKNGVYTGLRTVTNSRKRSWFVFAGGTKLTLSAQSPIPKDDYSKLTGALTSQPSRDGDQLGRPVRQASRRPASSRRQVEDGEVGDDPQRRSLTPPGCDSARDTRVRVIWRGVIDGPSRFVDVR